MPDAGGASSTGGDSGSTGSDSGSTGSGSDTGSTGGDTGSTGGGSDSGSTGGTGSCEHRTDCPGSQACLGDDTGHCGDADPNASCTRNDVCEKGEICQAMTCVPGCFSNADCHGTGLPRCVPGNPGHCAACTSASQCNPGEVCQSGDCVVPTVCTTGEDCQNLGCVDGICAPCTSSDQCASGLACDPSSGNCAPPTGCLSDAQCSALNDGSPAWYCDAAAAGLPACELGCVPDAECSTPQRGCCNIPAGLTCNTTTHECDVVPPPPDAGPTVVACGECVHNWDCISGLCVADPSSSTGRSCADVCTPGNHCADPASSCYAFADAGGAMGCFPANGACTGQGFFCQGCTRDQDCSSGLCITDSSATDGGSCAIRCDANGNCAEPGASCATVYDISDPFQSSPKHACFPSGGHCN